MGKQIFFILMFILLPCRIFGWFLIDDLLRILADEAIKAPVAALHTAQEGIKLGADFIEFANVTREEMQEIENALGTMSTMELLPEYSKTINEDLIPYYNHLKMKVESILWGDDLAGACDMTLDSVNVLQRTGVWPNSSLCDKYEGTTQNFCQSLIKTQRKYLQQILASSPYFPNTLQNQIIKDYVKVQDDEQMIAYIGYSLMGVMNLFTLDYSTLESNFDGIMDTVISSIDAIKGLYNDIYEFFDTKRHFCLMANEYVSRTHE